MPSETSNRATIIAFLLVVVAIIVGGALLLFTRPQPVEITIIPPDPTATPLPTNTPSPITVYVTGAVANPETVVTIPSGGRVSDAIEAAGGLLDNADTVRVNLAGLLRDGDQVHVPFVGSVSTDAGAGIVDNDAIVTDDLDLATPVGGVVININTATLEELTTLPGIGAVTAGAIISYREENGPFANLQALDDVAGIGTSTLEALADLVVFE
jgi:competence protein ComEA